MDQVPHRDVTPPPEEQPSHEDAASGEPASHGNLVGLGIGLLVGVPMMLIGAVGIWRHSAATPIPNYLRFFVGGDILHDFVVAPIALLVGIVVLRRVPPIVRAPLRAALFTSAVVIAVAWPGIRHYGRNRTPDNASVQPLNYTTAALTVVAVVFAIAAVWLAISFFRARRTVGSASQSNHRTAS